MFPIIPSHLLRQAAPATRSPLASDHHLWNVWTDNILNGNSFARHHHKVKMSSPTVDCGGSESESEGDRTTPGCFASVAIPKGCQSRALENFEMYAPLRDAREKHIRMRPSSLGVLQADGNVPDHQWIKSMRLSEDTYSNNAIIETVNHKQLQVRIIKNVQPGEEILLWFSEGILALMYIPFLTPANIRGKCQIDRSIVSSVYPCSRILIEYLQFYSFHQARTVTHAMYVRNPTKIRIR